MRVSATLGLAVSGFIFSVFKILFDNFAKRDLTAAISDSRAGSTFSRLASGLTHGSKNQVAAHEVDIFHAWYP